MRGAIRVSAYSSTSVKDKLEELRDMKRIGWSAGLTLRTVGGEGMLGGNLLKTAAIAAWTSWPAASISRSNTNCNVILVLPRALEEVIESSSGTVENCLSNGVATDAAIVSGLAPGRLA